MVIEVVAAMAVLLNIGSDQLFQSKFHASTAARLLCFNDPLH
jgi:hypothetical protein